MGITHLFFDVGGVLGTPGWGTADRALAARHFDLDANDFDRRHRSVVSPWEAGRMTLDEYLDHSVFHTPRPFTRDAFVQYMLERSVPYPDSIAVARDAAATSRYKLMTLNNESEALNLPRLAAFGLRGVFHAFFSSCWLGMGKPAARVYRLALSLAQADGGSTVFVDDREENLEPARALGMHTIRFTNAAELRTALGAAGVTL